MHLTPTQLSHLKPHLVGKLESLSSEADCDVLADYLVELIKSEGDEADVIATTKEQLADFLPDCGRFVDGVFEDLRTGRYEPGYKGEGSTVVAGGRGGREGGGGHGGRDFGGAPGGRTLKRYRDEEEEMGESMSRGDERGNWRGRGERGVKAARRGRGDYAGRGRRGGYDGGATGGGYNPQAQGFAPQSQAQGGFGDQHSTGQMPFAFDLTNPMAMMQALQQAMGMLQGMQGVQGGQQRRTGKRCRDYDTKGVCTRGATCPYDHGEVYDDYEAQNPAGDRGHERGRGRGRGRGDRGAGRGGRGGRAPFSSAAPESDSKAIVVEQIPAEHFNEESVRDFFSEFGMIEDVEMQEVRKLAIVKYTDHEGARSAFKSPKVVFDNRFVKVYWYHPEALEQQNGHGHRGGRGRGRGGMNGERKHRNSDTNMSEPNLEDQIDPVEFRKQQEGAQQRFEELKAAKARREELEAKMAAQASERAALLQKLAEKTKTETPNPNNPSTNGADIHGIGLSTASTPAPPSTSSQTDALKAKLAALEAEARSIGINPDIPAPNSTYQDFAPRGRGRGFVPRGGFHGRGGYPHRGGWRGRGAYGGLQGGAVKRLDNRPRGFSVVFEQGKKYEDMQEGLRQYLLFSDQIQSARVSPHPGREDAALLVYTERYKAEMFLAAVQQSKNQLTHVGKVEVAWVPNGEVPEGAFPEVHGQIHGNGNGQGEVVGSWDGGQGAGNGVGKDEGMEDGGGDTNGAGEETNEAGEGGGGQVQGARQGQGQTEMNYDVADDDDERWMAE
ncbi:hypothetical protein BDZ85DRAFT_320993 [Elsinoe ampelina]|uniref:C3H1-type domain-containing protein n=1 Tax=Elsinoe ampelina TaxID=302913 RepID=A0A6A6G6I0_9PEZI|nr:hypothetical protein BDZ85DRAFT_320993 [Elsinoe ampelina]